MKAIRNLGKWLLLLVGSLLLTPMAQGVESVTYYHNDAAGTPALATDANGNLLWKETYLPYGKKQTNAAASATNPIGFTGKPYDNATGLSYMGARYYDPLVGRFTGIDPKGFDPAHIQSFNRYAYANNNPYKFVDPDGRWAVPVVIGLALWAVDVTIGTPTPPAHAPDAIYPVGFPDMTGALKAGTVGIGVIGAIERNEGREVLSAVERGAAKGVAQETAKVGELIATHGKTMSNKQLDKLTKSIKSEGIKEPLTVTEHQGKTYILDGHHRALAAPRAGITEVPINKVELPFGAYKTPADLNFTP